MLRATCFPQLRDLHLTVPGPYHNRIPAILAAFHLDQASLQELALRPHVGVLWNWGDHHVSIELSKDIDLPDLRRLDLHGIIQNTPLDTILGDLLLKSSKVQDLRLTGSRLPEYLHCTAQLESIASLNRLVLLAPRTDYDENVAETIEIMAKSAEELVIRGLVASRSEIPMDETSELSEVVSRF